MTTYTNQDFNLVGKTVNGINLPMKTFEGIDYNFWSFVMDNMEEHLTQLRRLDVKDDDVFICTYPRSGTNWMNDILHMLLNGTTDYGPLFAVIDNYPVASIEKMKSPRVLCSHLPFELLPEQLREKGKIICVFRNPKDVAVSLHTLMKNYNFIDYNASFEQYLHLFIDGQVPSGSWFQHALGWEKVIKDQTRPVLKLTYESLKKNLNEKVLEISNFLGLQLDSKLLSEIAKKCEFDEMFKEKAANIPTFVRNTNKHSTNYLFRKGKSGDWKNWFTVAQNEMFESIYKDRMKRSDLILD